MNDDKPARTRRINARSALSLIEQYVGAVLAGELPTSRLVRLACERHRADLDRDDLAFDVEVVDDWLEFTRKIKHPRGDASERGETFDPLPWQVFVVGSLLGWRVQPSGHRRYRLGLIEVARGNGKTVLMGSLLAWAFSRGQGRNCYTFATTQRQARLAFTDAANMLRSMATEQVPDARSERRRWADREWTISTTSVRDAENRNTLDALPAKESSLDGLDPAMYVADECSEMHTRALQKLTTSTVKRRSAFGVMITTPGTDEASIYYDYRAEGVGVLEGDEDADGTFYYLAGIDDSDDPADSSTYIKANPSLGQTVLLTDLEQRYQSDLAKGPRYVADFVRFHCCRFTGDATAWIPAEHWDACHGGERPDADLVGGRAWVGVDLSKTRDLSAVMAIIEHPQDGTLWVSGWYCYPEDQARERERMLQMPILTWGLEGLIHLCPGRTIDYTQVHDRLRQIHQTYDTQAIFYDPHLTGWGEQQLESEGLPLWGLRQTITQLSPGTLHLEELVAKQGIRHDGDPVLSRAIAHARTVTDVNSNIRLVKRREAAPIDPAMALCFAARALLESTAMPDSCPVV